MQDHCPLQLFMYVCVCVCVCVCVQYLSILWQTQSSFNPADISESLGMKTHRTPHKISPALPSTQL